ncbi:uncharacterized protein LOC116849985 [Odontomachus brunneus]|uniref:uncharacterized protein LOC116849985 n=1 Tax=Odontomachus brunneus TaxID=486640 RepID=UPI0013F19170|nr:uncharacterized protein LOC116849985 [Odontomachus brunneus]
MTSDWLDATTDERRSVKQNPEPSPFPRNTHSGKPLATCAAPTLVMANERSDIKIWPAAARVRFSKDAISVDTVFRLPVARKGEGLPTAEIRSVTRVCLASTPDRKNYPVAR